VPMRCNHCGAPTHYDARIEDYVHDTAPACWLTYGPAGTRRPVYPPTHP
jgi:hypothetical protein